MSGGGSSSAASIIGMKRMISPGELRQKKGRIHQEVSDLTSGQITELSDYLKGIASEKKNEEIFRRSCDKFIHKGNGYRLGDLCAICISPLLDDIDSPAFGVTSYKCRCTKNQLIHSRCMTSLVAASRGNCASCHSVFSVATTTDKNVRSLKTFQVDSMGRVIDLTGARNIGSSDSGPEESEDDDP